MEKDTSINIRKRDRSSSPFLYDLIHSMTPGEKKYFKQSAKSDTSAKNYLTIFETLEKQESFDDEAAYELLKTKIKQYRRHPLSYEKRILQTGKKRS